MCTVGALGKGSLAASRLLVGLGGSVLNVPFKSQPKTKKKTFFPRLKLAIFTTYRLL